MVSFSGTINLSNVNDRDLAIIFETKTKHPGAFNFNPQLLQPAGGLPTNPLYNRADLVFSSEEGLDVIRELLRVLKGEAKTVGAQ
jgi:hypothetical protein